MSLSEFEKTYLYYGMPEEEFKMLLNDSVLRIIFLRHRGQQYELGFGNKTPAFQVGFYQGRLVQLVYRQQKGWLRYWSVTRAPFARTARFSVRSAVTKPEAVAAQIERILGHLGYVPRHRSWGWFTHSDPHGGYADPESYSQIFDLTGRPDPVLELWVITRTSQSDCLEIRVSVGEHERIVRNGYLVDPYPASVSFRPVEGYADLIPDFTSLDAFAQQFYTVVDALVHALRAGLGPDRVERLQ